MTNPPISDQVDQEELKPRCHLGFSIAGSSLDFGAISETLNQKSPTTRRAGSRISAALDPLQEDVWSINSPLGPLEPLVRHLQWLREQLEPHIPYLSGLSTSAVLRIYIGFTFSQEQNGFAIPSDCIRLFASFNAFIEMYILYNFGEDLAGGAQ
jgi:hypothetical protein